MSSQAESWTQVARISAPPEGEDDIFPLFLEVSDSPVLDTETDQSGDEVLTVHKAVGELDLVTDAGDPTATRFRIEPGLRVSFATVFNAFPASYWSKSTVATKVKLQLSITGPATVFVYKSGAGGNAKQVARQSTEAGSEELSFDLPLSDFADGGWYWFEMVARGDTAELSKGAWLVNAEPVREPTLSIGITTFNRPDYCARTLATLGNAKNLENCLKRIYVVDQGNQNVVDDPLYPKAAEALGDRLQIIYQGNLGGSGGFSRGMYESLTARETQFHLLLDDDVTVQPESIERIVLFGSLCRDETIIGGQMFDINAKSVAHSFGEGINKYRWLWGPVEGTKNRINLAKRNLKDRPILHRRIDVDYNGWWMELIPVSVIEKLGFSLPIFIKWDDLEYGLRAAEHGISTVTLPGAGLWHVSWLDKDDSRDWQAYFHERNRILTALLHSPYKKGGRLLYELATMDLKHLVSAEYYAQTIRLMALKDILSGPDHLHESIKTRLPQIRALTAEFSEAQYKKSLDDFPAVVPDTKPKNKGRVPSQPNKITLLPWTAKALVRQLKRPKETAKAHPEASISHNLSKFYVLNDYDSALVSKADGSGYAWYKRDPEKYRQLLLESVKLRNQLFRSWNRLRDEYRAALPKLVTEDNWKPTFGIEPEQER